MEERLEHSCSETGDIIAASQMLIEAGIRNDDQESINAGILKWSTVWPEDVVRQMSAVLIATIRSELASADASITNGIPE